MKLLVLVLLAWSDAEGTNITVLHTYETERACLTSAFAINRVQGHVEGGPTALCVEEVK